MTDAFYVLHVEVLDLNSDLFLGFAGLLKIHGCDIAYPKINVFYALMGQLVFSVLHFLSQFYSANRHQEVFEVFLDWVGQ